MGKTRVKKKESFFGWNEFDIVSEIEYGDNKRRLIETYHNKKRYIQLWSSLSKEWRTVVSYNVEEEWEGWKRFADIYAKKHGDGRRVRSNSQLGGVAKRTQRKPKSQTSTSSSKDSKLKNGKSRSKNSRRVQRSSKKN